MSDLATIEGPPIWDKRKGEGVKAYAAFTDYLLMGTDRSTAKLAVRYSETTGRNPDTIRRQLDEWSRKHDWVARADAYLEDWLRRLREEVEQEREAFLRQQRGMGTQLQAAALTRMRGRAAQDGQPAVAPLDLNEMGWGQLIDALKTGRDLAAFGHGMPTHLIAAKLLMVAPHEHEEILRKLIDGLMPLIPEELHDRAWAVVQRIGEGR